MANTGPSRGDHDVEDAVAASLLRIGRDTRAARLFTQLGPVRTAAALAERLGVASDHVTQRLEGSRHRARALLTIASRQGLGATPLNAPGYPELLGHIVDPPIVLWHRGDLSAAGQPAVAVVGSRRPSAAGLATAGRLAHDLARAGLVVVSGMARGIDAAAHQGALRAGGRSVAVLGCGVDVTYPPEHRGLATRLTERGCLLSELPPGTPPVARHFPLRNRLISGLSRAVVVVEAADRSGSLITARMALEQGRSVCAVPGNVVSGCHQGCHALIKDGARLVETVEDILEELSWDLPTGHGRSLHGKHLIVNGLLDRMRVGEPVGIDTLAATTGYSGPALLAELSHLELAGRVERTLGGMFVRLD